MANTVFTYSIAHGCPKGKRDLAGLLRPYPVRTSRLAPNAPGGQICRLAAARAAILRPRTRCASRETSVYIKEKLDALGYCEVEGVLDTDMATSITADLGPLRSLNGKMVQTIHPRESSQATSKSFSHHFGHEAFPLHTDTAFWPQPARYIIFQMSRASPTCSVVLPAHQTMRLFKSFQARNPVFTRKTTSGACYSLPWHGDNLNCVLFDPCLMRPVNNAAAQLAKALEDAFDQAIPIEWTGSKALIVDNWRSLHGRGPAHGSDRTLTRFYRG